MNGYFNELNISLYALLLHNSILQLEVLYKKKTISFIIICN